jgi:Fungal specific transcription factor domain
MEGPICEDYLRISGRALVAGGYLHARPYSVEATLLYGVVKLCQQQDTDMEAWMIIGVATRLAVKMGYHRDPCHLKDISPFESEMRRRIFYVVEGLDVLLSFQAGLPPILYDQNADTGPPTNLLDTDFDEDCQALPPPRPPTDPTPMLYCCCKRQQVKLLRRVSLHALSFKAPSYEETMKLDSELQDVHANLPLCVRMKPLSSSFSESTQTVLSRLIIELLYHRSICVLHRCYLSYDKTNPAYDYSRRICTGSALQVLKYEAELHLACQPGGRFSKARWITTSLILYDFLLSAMIVSLDLYESCNKMASASREELEIQTRKYDALKQSQVIWTSRKDISRDARHASRVLAVMLSKVPRPNISSTLPINHHTLLGEQQGPSIEGNVGTLQNPRAPYISTDSNPSPQNLPEYIVDSDSTSADPLNAIFSESDPIDWVRP